MKSNFSFIAGTVLALVASAPVGAQFYSQTNLVSDLPGKAQIQDSDLVNSWGVSSSSTSPFWVSDAGKSVSTIYGVDPTTNSVTKEGLTVSVPLPSGQVHNAVTTDFLISGTPAAFIFASLNGKIYGWSGGASATQAAAGATPSVYTGIAIGLLSGVQHLYVANAGAGHIDVYDNTFANVNAAFAGKWVDPDLPAGLTPFNIVNINGSLFVSYAPTSPTVVGFGVVDVFDTSGNFVKRFAAGSSTLPLYDPWGMVVAPATFGEFSNALLVGDFNLGNGAASPPAGGPGYILAFDVTNGSYLGRLKGTDGNPLQIDGLWQLIFGNGGNGGDPNTLYFAAGIENQMHGLFGSLNTCTGPVITGAAANPDMLWPPNNHMVSVAIDYGVTDNCDSAPACSLGVTVSDSGGGVDNLANSFLVVDPHTVELEAARNGGGDGRIYSIEITCNDKLPLSSNATVVVTVPHDQGQGHKPPPHHGHGRTS